MQRDKHRCAVLLATSIDRMELDEWADNHLAKAWGAQAAARLCHIARTGFDGRVGRGRKGDRPHSLPVSSDTVVPGACAPIKNLYHVSQALVWIAQQGKNVETSQSRMNQIARLLRTLIDNESIDLGMID